MIHQLGCAKAAGADMAGARVVTGFHFDQDSVLDMGEDATGDTAAEGTDGTDDLFTWFLLDVAGRRHSLPPMRS